MEAIAAFVNSDSPAIRNRPLEREHSVDYQFSIFTFHIVVLAREFEHQGPKSHFPLSSDESMYGTEDELNEKEGEGCFGSDFISARKPNRKQGRSRPLDNSQSTDTPGPYFLRTLVLMRSIFWNARGMGNYPTIRRLRYINYIHNASCFAEPGAGNSVGS